MALLLTPEEAQIVAQLSGVVDVRKDRIYELDTDAGPQWIGASSIWDGSATGGAGENRGEGVIVGVLDTGVNMDETFANYLAANPATGGNPETLNLASMRSNDCNGVCSWQREVCNTLATNSAWTVNTPAPWGISVAVTPSAFEFGQSAEIIHSHGFEDEAGPFEACQVLDITVIVNDQGLVDTGEMVFSGFSLSEEGAQAPDAVLTIAILPTGVD
jgi:hypothetical protein